MVKVETLKEDGFVRILRCREGNKDLVSEVAYRFGEGLH